MLKTLQPSPGRTQPNDNGLWPEMDKGSSVIRRPVGLPQLRSSRQNLREIQGTCASAAGVGFTNGYLSDRNGLRDSDQSR